MVRSLFCFVLFGCFSVFLLRPLSITVVSCVFFGGYFVF